MWLDDGYAQLKSFLVFDARATARISGNNSSRRYDSRRCTDKVRRINLYLVAPFGFHVCQSHFGLLEQDWILNVPEANRDTRRIAHSVSLDFDYIAMKRPSSGFQDELEFILGLNLET